MFKIVMMPHFYEDSGQEGDSSIEKFLGIRCSLHVLMCGLKFSRNLKGFNKLDAIIKNYLSDCFVSEFQVKQFFFID